jgi:hypothetical protein
MVDRLALMGLYSRKWCKSSASSWAVADLLCHVSGRLAEAGHGLDVRQWSEPAILLAVQAAKEFEAKARAKAARKDKAAQRIAGKETSHASR